MDFAEVLGVLFKWCIPALLAMAAGVGIILFIYKVIYKNVFDGEKRITAKTFILLVLLIGYLFLVFALTNLNRGANYTDLINVNIFSGYIDAWNSWSLLAFQLIVFNVILFIPLGILLPLLNRKCNSLRAVFVIALGFSLFIELFQLTTHSGIFELDDIFHNTLGAVLGYLLFKVFRDLAKNKRVHFKSVMKAAIIPVSFAVLFFGAQIFYGMQEFGNMDVYPSRGTNISRVSVSSRYELDKQESTASIFLNTHTNMPERGAEIADVLRRELGLSSIQFSGRDGENRQYVFSEKDGEQYYLTYFIREGTWSLNSSRYDLQDPKLNDNATIIHIENILKNNEFLPAYASMESDQNEILRWDAKVEDLNLRQEGFISGVVMSQVSSVDKIISLNNELTENKYIRQVPIISQQEAFDKIRQGSFDSMAPFQAGDDLVITDCEINYRYDSKGYYQPVYLFTGMLNGEADARSFIIPAIKK